MTRKLFLESWKVSVLLISSHISLTITTEEEGDSEEEEPEDEEEDLPPALSKGERNSQLTVGYKGDRSYVVRGNNIGVFSHSGDNQVKYYATISKVTDTKGKQFNPRNVRHISRKPHI